MSPLHLCLTHMRHRGTGGTERVLNQTAAALVGRGHRVTILCRSHEDVPAPGVEFVVLKSPALGAGARLWAFARAVERHLASHRGAYDLVYGLGRTWTQDVLRLGGGLHATYMELAHRATRTPGQRLLGLGARKQRLAARVEKRQFAEGSSSLVICNSERVRGDLLGRYPVDPDRVRVIHNAADVDRFHPRHRGEGGAQLRRDLGIEPDAPVVLFLGTGYARKGLGELLSVFPGVLGQRPETRLLVVGYDSDRPRYEALARAEGFGDRAHFLGGRRDPEVCFGAGDVYVLPTRNDPFANSTVEALASGLPVITTRTNGGCERIEEGRSGSVVDFGDRDALAAALGHWLMPEHLEPGRREARRAAETWTATAAMEATCTLLEKEAARLASPGSRS